MFTPDPRITIERRAVLRIRIRDLVLLDPLDLGSGMGKNRIVSYTTYYSGTILAATTTLYFSKLVSEDGSWLNIPLWPSQTTP
jgi:hypothetical protein